jgi:hypothetical protein
MEHADCDEVGDDSGESGSDGEQEPAVSLPEFTEAGGLGEDIHDVGCTVGDVRYDRQQEKAQPEIKREYGPGRGISSCEVDDYDGCERQVVDEPPTFPEFDGISDVVPQVGGVHGNESNLKDEDLTAFVLRPHPGCSRALCFAAQVSLFQTVAFGSSGLNRSSLQAPWVTLE